jgi:hypothetical protein
VQLELRVQPRELGVPRDRHVRLVAAADRHPRLVAAERVDDLRAVPVAVDQEPLAQLLGGLSRR